MTHTEPRDEPRRGAMTPGAGLDLSAPRRVHIVAIGGAAMSTIARYLDQLGHHVSGSDARDSGTVRALTAHGIPVAVGHAVAHVGPDIDYVVASTAVRPDNEELAAARALGIPVLWRGEAMDAVV